MSQPLRVGAFPGIRPRLLRLDLREREDRHAYERVGGYAPDRLLGPALIDAVESAGLRGRGGAAFPMGTKLRSVADRPGPRVIVANGEEGEPASVKDRWLMRFRPHLVLDGLLLSARAVGAERAYVYLSDLAAAESVSIALDELGETTPRIELVTVRHGYVAGEETSAVRAIDGGEAKPTVKPPRPFEAGVEGRPTLVSNVETLANLPAIASRGPAEFRSVGTRGSPGTFLLTLSGGEQEPGLYEAPLGVSLAQALWWHRGPRSEPIGFLMGGFFAGLLGPRALDVRLAYDELREEGSGLGCGAVILLGSNDCTVAAATDVLSYFARENAKQCGPCIKGTAAMRDALASLALGRADASVVDRLRKWSLSLRERGACALLDGAAGVAGSLLREFPTDVERHLARGCERCSELVSGDLDRESRFQLAFEERLLARVGDCGAVD